MAQRRRGERVLGPYEVRGEWRVIVVSGTGERVTETYASEADAKKVVRSLRRKLAGDDKTIADAMRAYQTFMLEKGNKRRSIDDTIWRIEKFFPEPSNLV